MAPQVGLEPTTLRLTAECSAIELLRNIGIRRRPTLPDRYQSSTIGTEGLNFCVRYGNRWNLFVIATGNSELFRKSLFILSLGSSLPAISSSLYRNGLAPSIVLFFLLTNPPRCLLCVQARRRHFGSLPYKKTAPETGTD